MNSIYFIFLAGIVLLFGRGNNVSHSYAQHNSGLSQTISQHFLLADDQSEAVFFVDETCDSSIDVESDDQLFFIQQKSDPSSEYCWCFACTVRQSLFPLLYDLPPPAIC